jgi:hypothetical protein
MVAFLAAVFACSSGGYAPAASWFGPATATFAVAFPGNPYDPAQNDVRVRFIGDKGQTYERLAFYDGDEGVFRAILVAPVAGKYRPVLLWNGTESAEVAVEGVVSADRPLKRGFLGVDPLVARRFRWSNGERYVPLGMNLGWQNPDLPPMADQIRTLAESGGNWTRIWACHWDGKNPWWPQGDAVPDGELWPPAFRKWDVLAAACETHDVGWQFVLFHHGAYSSAVNPNWPDHPWNAKNGGFLKNAADFFTDPEAKRRSKLWLRYAVARYGHNPNIMAWELFNEVEWVDARYQKRWNDVLSWHKKMAEYLRSIDPYGRMVTTSSTMEEPGLYDHMDYLQPHVYPVDLTLAIQSVPGPQDKPLFFGEFGPGAPTDDRIAMRDGLFAGIFAAHAGPGQYWYWDTVHKQQLYDEFKKARRVIDAARLAERDDARPWRTRVTTPETATLRIVPGKGWGESTRREFTLSPGEPVEGLAEASSFLQGKAHEQFGSSFKFRLAGKKASRLTVRIGTAAKAGAVAEILIDGRTSAIRRWEASEQDQRTNDVLTAEIPASAEMIEIRNTGPDWVVLNAIEIEGYAAAAQVQALGMEGFVLLRVRSVTGTSVQGISIGGLPLPDGEHAATLIRLDTGEESRITVRAQGSGIRGFNLPGVDAVLVLNLP